MKVRFVTIIIILLLVYFPLQAQIAPPLEGNLTNVIIQKESAKVETVLNNNASSNVELTSVKAQWNGAQDKINLSFRIRIGSPEQTEEQTFTVAMDSAYNAHSERLKVQVLNLSSQPIKPTMVQAFTFEDVVKESVVQDCSFEDFLELQLSIEFSNGKVYHLTITILVAHVGRISEANVLLNERRRRIYEYLIRHPGAHLREIMRSFNLGVHAVQWHLSMLERFHLIGHDRCGRYLIFYPIGNRPSNLEVKIRNALQNEKTTKILFIIASNPGISPTSVYRQLNLHKNTANYHIQKLLKLGLIEKAKQYTGKVKLFATENGGLLHPVK